MIEDALQKALMEINYLYLVIAGSSRSVWIGREDRKAVKMLESEEKRNIVKQRTMC